MPEDFWRSSFLHAIVMIWLVFLHYSNLRKTNSHPLGRGKRISFSFPALSLAIPVCHPDRAGSIGREKQRREIFCALIRVVLFCIAQKSTKPACRQAGKSRAYEKLSKFFVQQLNFRPTLHCPTSSVHSEKTNPPAPAATGRHGSCKNYSTKSPITNPQSPISHPPSTQKKSQQQTANG